MTTYQFNTEEAAVFGVDESIMLYNLRFWIKKNQANNRHFYEGRYWTYNSAKAFSKLFVFWNERKIHRVLKSLEDSGAIVSGNFNEFPCDRTKWFSVCEKTIRQKLHFHFPDMSNGATGNVGPIPDVNTDINTDRGDTPPIRDVRMLDNGTMVDPNRDDGQETPQLPLQDVLPADPSPSAGSVQTSLTGNPDVPSKAMPESLQVVLKWGEGKGYDPAVLTKFFDYYERLRTEMGGRVWKDQNGSTVKDWKRKFVSVWLDKSKSNASRQPATQKMNHTPDVPS